ncbi:MAG: mandelate racemase, partial [Acidobacteria bacterium]|nr:mandelate racemase [Acidobacteriota bacterium]
MDRRQFLAALSAPAAALAQGKRLPITDVEIWQLEGSEEGETGVNRQHQVQPAHVYAELRPPVYHEPPEGKRGTIKRTARYLVIKTAQGVEGLYGPVDAEACVVVDRQLKQLVIGQDALAVETRWDQLFRSNRHSRASHYMMGISALDNALWDLRGRYYGAPVYQLLGGPTREKATVYGSTLGSSVELDLAGKRAKELKSQGFRHQKWFLAYGPGDGAEGLEKNIELVRVLREAVGPTVDLMFDAFMGWDLNYAMAWCAAVEQYRPRWLEEAFHVDKIDSFVQLAR